MLTIQAQVDISDDDRKMLSGIASLENEKANKAEEKANEEVLKDRGRALDQVKRLYAVVMGFAITSAITSTVTCIRRLPWDMSSGDVYFILAAQIFILLSLVPLFFLAAERILDRRYLQKDDAVPLPGKFLLDLIAIGGPAIIFLIIGNTFPTFSEVDNAIDVRRATTTTFWWFSHLLLFLYLTNMVLLAIHGVSIFGQAKSNGEGGPYDELKRHYKIWMVLNLASLILVGLAVYSLGESSPASLTVQSATRIAVALVGWHALRFAIDFGQTFPSYFPTKPLKSAR